MMTSVLLAATLLLQAQPQSPTLPERFTAFGISLGDGMTESGTAQMEIVIDRWSTREELDELFTAGERGQRALADALNDLEAVGSIRTVQSLAHALHYAVQRVDEDGTRHIYLATSRPMSYLEMVRGSRSVAYPITFVELTVDEEGRGEGQMSIAARITISSDRSRLYVLNYAVRPVLLKSVRRRD